jgi:predicted amidohydrolase
MRIAALQMRTVAGNREANLARIEEAVRNAVEQRADLLIVPELAIPGYGAGSEMARLAEAPDGESWKHLSALSRETGVAVVAGFAERVGDILYNSAFFINGDEPPVVYRKSHLYGPYERGLFEPGKPLACIVDHCGLKLGLLICYDVEFPENARRLAQAGAQAILVPTALPRSDHAELIAGKMIPVRAFENQVFVAYVNYCGTDAQCSYAGLSGIAAPDGTMLATAGADDEVLLVATLDIDAFRKSAEENPYLADLRPA